jgi:predicted porin
MKKNLLITSALAALISTSAFAKTEGNYVGVDLIHSNFEIDNSTTDDGDVSLGINYKHAFNFGGLYIAPEIFFDYSNIDLGSSSEIEHLYGVKANVGYDISDKVSIFGAVGYAEDRQKDGTTSYAEEFTIYGLGATYSLDNSVSLKAAYDIAEGEALGSDETYNIFRLGVAYNF